MRFVQARNFTKADRSEVDLIVIHDMEYPERPTAAEWCADFFAGPNAPKASAHYCLAPETRVLFADLVWRPIGDVREGHKLTATEEHAPGMSGRTMQTADVTRAKRREAKCVRITFSDGREVVCSTDHRWLAKPPAGGAPWEWRASEMLGEGCRLLAPLRPWEQRVDRDAGYLEGIYDGEGCWSSNGDLSFAQKRGAVLDRAHGILNAAGIPYRLADQRENGVVVTDLSGLQATLQVGGQFRPQRLMREPRWVGRALRSRTHSNHVTIASIERIGVREVVSIETSTHTFFAEGIVSHNCVDNDSVIQCVRDEDVAWHAPGANGNGIGIEHAGYARQSAAEWRDDFSVAMLELSAELTARLCLKYSIPIARPSVTELKAGARGIVGHADCTAAWPVDKRTGQRRTHWDPGPGFPWDWYLSRVRFHAELLSGDAMADENIDDPCAWPRVHLNGTVWLVAPIYVPFVGIGQAEELAAAQGCELPSPALVDAIWKAADLKLDATRCIRQHDGSLVGMSGAAMLRKQAGVIDELMDGRSLGSDFFLLAGLFKDIVRAPDGSLGIYGWQRLDGSNIQPLYTKHARGWMDYSQGLRLCRKAPAT